MSKMREVVSGRLSAALAAFAAALAAAGSSAAAQEAPVREGLQVRAMLGPAWMYAAASGESANGEDGAVTGFGIGGLATVGGTPAPGLVVGGGAMGAHIFAPEASVNGNDTSLDADAIALVVGPHIDYYPDPGEGLATLAAGDDRTEQIALGFGGVVAVGHDWWLSDRWSAGVLARVQVMKTFTDIPSAAGATDVSYTTILPVIMASAVYH